MGRDIIKGQRTVQLPDGREFAVVKGRRWTRVHEYLSNGQLTARWFYDESTGEAREAEGARKPRNWRLGGGAKEFVAWVVELANDSTGGLAPANVYGLADQATEREVAPRRDWTNIGREYTEPYRDAIEVQIAALEWGNDPKAAMVPALGINECIAQLGIPKVSAYATNGYLETGAGEDRAYCSIYGIEGNYTNGRVRLYVLDRGTEMIPLAADVWPVAQAVA